MQVCRLMHLIFSYKIQLQCINCLVVRVYIISVTQFLFVNNVWYKNGTQKRRANVPNGETYCPNLRQLKTRSYGGAFTAVRQLHRGKLVSLYSFILLGRISTFSRIGAP